MSGFGHRVYKNYDPRAKVIKKLAEEVFSIVGRDPLIEVTTLWFYYYYSFGVGVGGALLLFANAPISKLRVMVHTMLAVNSTRFLYQSWWIATDPDAVNIEVNFIELFIAGLLWQAL